MKKKLKILVLVHPQLIPPKNAATYSEKQLDDASWRTEYYVINTLKANGHNVQVLGVSDDLEVILKAKNTFRPNIAFNLLEEFAGEAVFDFKIVSYLESIKLPYTGCNPKGLLMAKDKIKSKKILAYHGIKTSPFFVAPMNKKFKISPELTYPLIVKPTVSEGSLGIGQNSVVNSEVKLLERISFIHTQIQSDAIIEEYIQGKDIYVTVLGNKQIQILPLIELVFKNAPKHIHQIATERVKWSSKYRDKYQIDICKAQNLTEQTEQKCIEICRKVYKGLSLNGVARIDIRMSDEGELYFLEANPNPNIADTDEVALAAKFSGQNYSDLIDQIVQMGLSWDPLWAYN